MALSTPPNKKYSPSSRTLRECGFSLRSLTVKRDLLISYRLKYFIILVHTFKKMCKLSSLMFLWVFVCR